MKSFLLLLSLFLFVQFSEAQENLWNEGEIYLKTGAVKTGLIRFSAMTITGPFVNKKGKTKILFKTGKKSDKVEMENADMEKIVLSDEEGQPIVFKFMPLEKDMDWCRIVYEGNNILYARTISGSGMMMGSYGGGGSVPIGTSFESDEYYIKLKNEKTAFCLLKSGRGMNYFEKRAKDYFADCGQLLSALEKKGLKKEDIPDLVKLADSCN